MSNTVSIVIITSDNNFILEETLPHILEQEYEAQYEVIVARETRQGEIKDIVETLFEQHPNLKSTYLPDKPIYATNEQIETLLAVKASAYSNILVVSPAFMPPSSSWLQDVMQKINNTEANLHNNTNLIILGEEHYAQHQWIYRKKHKLRTNKTIRKCNAHRAEKIKAISPDKNTRSLFAIMFNKDGYIGDPAIRQIIDRHLSLRH